jgi:hypothetical protein
LASPAQNQFRLDAAKLAFEAFLSSCLLCTLHMHTTMVGIELHVSSGRTVVWAFVRSKTAEVFKKILEDLKAACTAMLGDRSFAPSCILVDNSNAEINAARCALACL